MHGKEEIRIYHGRYSICNVRNAIGDQRHLNALYESLMPICSEGKESKLSKR